jgi:hypothetical protein
MYFRNPKFFSESPVKQLGLILTLPIEEQVVDANEDSNFGNDADLYTAGGLVIQSSRRTLLPPAD